MLRTDKDSHVEYANDDYGREEITPQEMERIEILNSLGLKLAKSRSDAIKGRANLGIEEIWNEDEEYYEGIDEHNRGESAAWRNKPAGQAALRSPEDTGSTVFVNITAPYCDAASARVSDMLMPTDDKGWSIKNTPIPDLMDLVDDKETPDIDKAILAEIMAAGLEGEEQPEQPQQPGQELQPTEAMLSKAAEIKQRLIEQQKQILAIAVGKAAKAEKRIEDWHIEGQYHAEMRLVIEDAAKIGTGVLKGPIPKKRRTIAYKNGELLVEDIVQPISTRVDYKNCFPDPACRANIHNGSFHFERDEINIKHLLELREDEDYIGWSLDEVIAEGPMRAVANYNNNEDKMAQLGLELSTFSQMYEIWYYYGVISRKDLEASGCECPDDGKRFYSGHLTMINNRVIKADLNLLDTGEFPYDYMVWKPRKGMPFGTGLSRAVRVAQDIVNGGTRNMMDNAGLAGGPMWIYTDGIVAPIDGKLQLKPRKGWRRTNDSLIAENSKTPAFEFIIIPMIQKELQAIIDFGLKIAEDVTGMPMILQGQQGSAPDTVGGMQIINNNASTVMRRIAKLFDDLITEPHVRRYYQYLLTYGEDDEKGEFIIDARGSSALVERDLKNQSILNMGPMVLNPTYGIDPKKWAKEFLMSQHLDASKFEYDDDDWKNVVAGMTEQQQQQIDPAQAAQIKSDSDTRIAQTKIDYERERDTSKMNIDIEFREFEQELAIMKLQNDDKLNTDKLRTSLSETVMKLKTQEKLSRLKPIAKLSATPPTEPAGHAKDGESYQS